MKEVVIDTIVDSIKLLPFLFLTYLIMEYMEHKTGEKAKNIIQKSGKFGPFLGSILGIFPQCGFSAAAANLYAGKIITLGTLLAIFLSTSDEMIPVLISEATPISSILQILGIKLVVGMLAGFAIDFLGNLKKKTREEEVQEKIGHICEQEHCHCEEGILKSSIQHTFHIFFFIFVISFLINGIIYWIGEESLSNFILNMPIVGPILAGFLGLIPNCAGSVILTQLYLEQVISFGSMIGGLLVGSGIGILILFRVNKNIKENLKILAILYVIGVISGIFLDVITKI